MSETPALFATSKHGDWLASNSLAGKVRKNHSIPAGLPWSDGVKESRDYDRYTFFTEVRQSQPFVQRLRTGVGPSRMHGRTHHQIVLFAERNLRALAVNLGGRRDQHRLLFPSRGLEHDLSAVDVRFNSPDRLFDDQADTHRRCKMYGHVATVNQFGH